jgi:hypothetical protein
MKFFNENKNGSIKAYFTPKTRSLLEILSRALAHT